MLLTRGQRARVEVAQRLPLRLQRLLVQWLGASSSWPMSFSRKPMLLIRVNVPAGGGRPASPCTPAAPPRTAASPSRSQAGPSSSSCVGYVGWGVKGAPGLQRNILPPKNKPVTRPGANPLRRMQTLRQTQASRSKPSRSQNSNNKSSSSSLSHYSELNLRYTYCTRKVGGRTTEYALVLDARAVWAKYGRSSLEAARKLRPLDCDSYTFSSRLERRAG